MNKKYKDDMSDFLKLKKENVELQTELSLSKTMNEKSQQNYNNIENLSKLQREQINKAKEEL